MKKMLLSVTKVCLVAILAIVRVSAIATHTSTAEEPTHRREVTFNETHAITDDFNPMELYVNQDEGVSLAYEDQGWKFVVYMNGVFDGWWEGFVSGGYPFKTVGDHFYTRTYVEPSIGNNVYPMTFVIDDLSHKKLWSRRELMKVHKNNDGTVSLSCESNGRFMTWGNEQDPPEYEWFTRWDYPLFPGCLESGICPHCRYNLVVGSITDLQIKIVDLSWGSPDNAIPATPSQVAEDSTLNYSDEPMSTKLTVSYLNTISDTTIWEHAWGFELSASAKAKVDIPFIGGIDISTTATASYNGKYGTQNTETRSETLGDTKEVTCPGGKKCILKFVASKLENYDIPFTATVERSQDDGSTLQFQENGVWRGVQAFNFQTIYCTEDLNTGESNCPMFK